MADRNPGVPTEVVEDTRERYFYDGHHPEQCIACKVCPFKEFSIIIGPLDDHVSAKKKAREDQKDIDYYWGNTLIASQYEGRSWECQVERESHIKNRRPIKKHLGQPCGEKEEYNKGMEGANE